MDPETLAKLLANAQGGAPAVAPAPAPVPARPVPAGSLADDLRTALAAAPDKEAYLAAWEANGWDVSAFRVVEVAIPQAAAPADPVAELAEVVAENTKPKRGRPAKTETGARFDLIKACALGGVPASDVQSYLNLAGVA